MDVNVCVKIRLYGLNLRKYVGSLLLHNRYFIKYIKFTRFFLTRAEFFQISTLVCVNLKKFNIVDKKNLEKVLKWMIFIKPIFRIHIKKN